MAISKDDTVLTYSKFKEFWTQFAVLFNKKLDGNGVANNDTTTGAGYVLDARVGKTHGDEIDTLKDQMNGCYIAYDSNGKLGIKPSKNGAVQSFRQPVGTAAIGDVLAGKTFANKDNDNLTGTMPNNGKISQTIKPTGNNTATYNVPAGYTSGGVVTADGTASYAAGVTAADARVNKGSASYKDGYNAGNTAGYNSGYSAGKATATLTRLGSFKIGSRADGGLSQTFSIKDYYSEYASLGSNQIALIFEKHEGYRGGGGTAGDTGWTEGTMSKSYDQSTGVLSVSMSWTLGNGLAVGDDAYTFGVYIVQ